MSAIVRRAAWPPLNIHSGVFAAADKGAAAKFGAVIDMQHCRQPRDRPKLVNLPILQPCGFVENRMKQTKTYGQTRWGVHCQIEARHHATEHVNRERQPRATDWFARFFIDDDDVRSGMINLDNF
ncbi:MAG: hypothetical protein ACR65U_04260 [Methylocystis sp.]